MVGGGISDYTQTNSKEALLASLDKGYRYVELDLSYTADSQIVCTHGSEMFNLITTGQKNPTPPTLEQFCQRKIHGTFTPLTLQEALDIQKRRPFTFVTDGISDHWAIDHHFKDRKQQVLIEAKTISDYKTLKQKGYCVMMCINQLNAKGFAKYMIYSCMNKGLIDQIVISSNSSEKAIRFLKRTCRVQTFVYTCNERDYLTQHLGQEADMVYTDIWTFGEKERQSEKPSGRPGKK